MSVTARTPPNLSWQARKANVFFLRPQKCLDWQKVDVTRTRQRNVLLIYCMKPFPLLTLGL